MEKKSESNISRHFSGLTDPRIDRTKRHLLNDIVVIAICAVIGGADGWESIEKFGIAKREWFKSFLELPNGIPSHDTFSRVFSLIDPQEFQSCFLSFVQFISERIPGDTIAIDGKTLRGSYDTKNGMGSIHMVSAWANSSRCVLGQVKVENKSNEITAIPKLLKMLDVNGCIVTIDAMGCQKEIAHTITKQGADYILALKGNQGKLHEEVKRTIEKAEETGFADLKCSFHKTHETGHGRVETRCYMLMDAEDICENVKWPNLNSIGVVQAEREVDGKKSLERRYYITSLVGDVKEFAKAARGHWGVENSLHWVLDVAFREDECRIRKDNAPQNFAVLRHIALNLLKRDQKRNKKLKAGIKSRSSIAGWDTDYLREVLRE